MNIQTDNQAIVSTEYWNTQTMHTINNQITDAVTITTNQTDIFNISDTFIISDTIITEPVKHTKIKEKKK